MEIALKRATGRNPDDPDEEQRHRAAEQCRHRSQQDQAKDRKGVDPARGPPQPGALHEIVQRGGMQNHPRLVGRDRSGSHVTEARAVIRDKHDRVSQRLRVRRAARFIKRLQLRDVVMPEGGRPGAGPRAAIIQQDSVELEFSRLHGREIAG